MTWLAGGHPVLDANTLEQEAYKNLELLLNQLQTSEATCVSSVVAFAIINRLLPSTTFCPSSPSTLETVRLNSALPTCSFISNSCNDDLIKFRSSGRFWCNLILKNWNIDSIKYSSSSPSAQKLVFWEVLFALGLPSFSTRGYDAV